MKFKVLASISIFLLLFSVAWLLEQKEKREFFIPGEAEEEVVEIVPANFQQEKNMKRRHKIFDSREYVRIEAS
ncbi:hypothetical protein ACFYKX_17460 [Cytobacillus sp. FJAT-54145]|uniref:Uncharacterized protein n=1 Tax=Cytobacillus spartinae TaxID=3299023 RepID=A0ABW6KDQ4_9BACI